MMQKRVVELRAHDSTWANAFAGEAAKLTGVFGNNLIATHHIGSTAIPGIHAKPIIDMMPIVWNLEQVDSLNDVMAECGYIHKGENGIPGRRYFRKGSDLHHSHHVHVYQQSHPEIARHLLFRNYLCAYPEKAQAYNQLKANLAQKYKEDVAAYTSAKSEFIQAMIQESFAWQQERERPLRTLTTPRLHLIALSLPQLETCLQDPSLLAANLNFPLEKDIFNPIVREATIVKVSKMKLADPAHAYWHTYWLIVRRDDNLGIGSIGFKGRPDLSSKVEIGYGLSVNHRGQGYMTEAAQTMTRWAFAQPDCTAVFATTDPDNIPSHRVLQKIGMARNGERNGEWVWEMRDER
jgi:GrpB-like predicted nucleotidyltransferase (UPF0157 family)/RimJ/RimL family protein N-acetyltransferase